jgi:hypothetical protein
MILYLHFHAELSRNKFGTMVTVTNPDGLFSYNFMHKIASDINGYQIRYSTI